jgi:transcription antitermination factor NusG
MSEAQFQKAIANAIPEEKVVDEKIPLALGMIVEIFQGKFANHSGKITSIDKNEKTVNVYIKDLGEVQVFDIDIKRS